MRHRVSGRHNMLCAFEYYSIAEDTIRNNSKNWNIINCIIMNADVFIHYNFGDVKEHQTQKPLENVKVENCEILGLLKISEYLSETIEGTLTLENVKIGFRDGVERRSFVKTNNCTSVIERNVVLM